MSRLKFAGIRVISRCRRTHEPRHRRPRCRLELMATRSRLSGVDRWERETFSRAPERDAPFSTISGEPIRPLYTEEDLPVGIGGVDDPVGLPGEFPFTRGVYGSMYRGRLWTMRQFAGFGTAAETNERFRYLLDHGQTGLSTAFDMPSLMGHDSDHPRSLGEVGVRGWRWTRWRTWRPCLTGSTSARCRVSMTINAPAAIMLAFYVVAAEQQGVGPRAARRGRSRRTSSRSTSRRRSGVSR